MRPPSALLNLQHSLIDLNLRNAAPASLSASLVARYCQGQWEDILRDPLVSAYFWCDASQAVCSLTDHTSSPDPDGEVLVQLTVVATLLSVYVQANYTGPLSNFEPIELFPLSSPQLDESRLNLASLSLLSVAGEPAYHLAKSATLLLLAIKLLVRLSVHQHSGRTHSLRFPTIPWWHLRARALQRELLDEPVGLPDALQEQLEHLSQNHLLPLSHSLDPALGSQDWDRDLLSVLTLERSLAEHLSGNDKRSILLLERAVAEAQLEYSVTGLLGKRTKFQEKSVSQLVVLAQGRQRSARSDQEKSSALDGETQSKSANAESSAMPTTLSLNDDTLLEKMELNGSGVATWQLDPSKQPPLHPLEQALLLALSISIKNTSPAHGLTQAQMAPFVDKVLENPANWSVHSLALLIRSRLDSNRTRTVERGLLQLQVLVDQLTKDAHNDPIDKSTNTQRVRWAWSLALPPKWELERELAQKLRGLGVTRSAMEIFERLEMWEEVVQCYLSLESQELGTQLVRDLLDGTKIDSSVKTSKGHGIPDNKRRARLLCLLAELESNPAHWEAAWEVSANSSSRAMRSLGSYHFSRGNYTKARECLNLALGINPLFNKAWFVLGCAAMRQNDWQEAEIAFRKCVSLDEEDAEAWNNLATVYLNQAKTADGQPSESTDDLCKSELKRSSLGPADLGQDDVISLVDKDQQADSFQVPQPDPALSRLEAAFRALQQAAKLSYDSWRIWTNYMIVAVSVHQYTEAIHALGRVVELQGEQALDESVLFKILKVATSPYSDSAASQPYSRILQRLEDVLDRTLCTKCPNNPQVWESRAQICRFREDWRGTIDKQLTAYRVGVSQAMESWFNDAEGWARARTIVDRTVDVIAQVGPKLLPTDDQPAFNWKWQCRTILTNFLNKSKDAFEDQDGWIALSRRVEEL